MTGERITRTGMLRTTLCHTTGTRRLLPPAADARDDSDNEDAMFFELRRLMTITLCASNGPSEQSRRSRINVSLINIIYVACAAALPPRWRADRCVTSVGFY